MKAKQPRVFLLALLATVAIIVLQLLKRNDFQFAAQTGNPLQQIVTLPKSALPDHIGQWALVKYSEPDATKADTQKFLSHVWHFRSKNISCLVAFDQSHWHEWHELTECYRSAGWTLRTRELCTTLDQPEWPCVIATFSKSSLSATLIYSMAYRDGLAMAPLDLNADEASGANWLARIRARSELGSERSHPDPQMLAMQYQVFCTSISPIDDKATEKLLHLHDKARQMLSDEIKTAGPLTEPPS